MIMGMKCAIIRVHTQKRMFELNFSKRNLLKLNCSIIEFFLNGLKMIPNSETLQKPQRAF